MDLFILSEYIREFLSSKERRAMIEGEAYYLNEQQTNDLKHGFMGNMVDEKVQYLLGKEPTIKCEDDKCGDKLKEVLGDKFLYDLQGMALEASNKGIAWSQMYIDEQGLLKLMLIPSEQICPIWTDRTHTGLEALLRIYDVETYTGTHKEYVTHVELHENDGVTYYIWENGSLVLDAEKYLNIPDTQAKAGHFVVNGKHMTFNMIPFTWCKNNRYETNDLKAIKTLIDDYNIKRSEISDMLNKCKNYVYVIRNYGGDTEGDIPKKIEEKRVVYVDEDGGVDILTPRIYITAAETHYKQLKEDIQLFGKSVPRQNIELGNSPSGIALKFMYSGLDLKCNGLEAEMKFMFARMIDIVKVYLSLSRETLDDTIEIIFNRDITINEQEAITAAQSSMGVISQKTVVANHPWVTNLTEEMEQIEAEKPSLEDEYKIGGVVNE
ncbi:MAG: phage portal protein [Sarcina sp.]